MRSEESDLLAAVSGKAVAASWGNVLTPAMFGRTRLELYPTRLVEHTKHIVSETESHLLLSEVLGAAYLTRGNPALLAVGFATLPLFGLGLVFLILYFFLKYRFLVIHGQTFTQHLVIQGSPDKYLDFMDTVLEAVERAKREEMSAAGGGLAAVLPAAASRTGSADAISLRCSSCGADYRLPAGSAGKKFRCAKCKTVIQAPAE